MSRPMVGGLARRRRPAPPSHASSVQPVTMAKSKVIADRVLLGLMWKSPCSAPALRRLVSQQPVRASGT
jgi:hypothetical protein